MGDKTNLIRTGPTLLTTTPATMYNLGASANTFAYPVLRQLVLVNTSESPQLAIVYLTPTDPASDPPTSYPTDSSAVIYAKFMQPFEVATFYWTPGLKFRNEYIVAVNPTGDGTVVNMNLSVEVYLTDPMITW